MSKKVVLVLDMNFGEKILSFAKSMPVWVVESAENQVAIDHARHNGITVTTFKLRDGELVEKACARIIQSLDDHYNEFSQEQGYSELECIGITLAKVSLRPFIELGFDTFSVTAFGFLAKKIIR